MLEVILAKKYAGSYFAQQDLLKHESLYLLVMTSKVSKWPAKFIDGLESFQMAQHFNPENNTVLQKHSTFAKTFQVALLPCYLATLLKG